MGLNDKQIVLRPVDVALLLKKITPAGHKMNGKQLAESLGISPSEVSISLERNRMAHLVDAGKSRVNVLSFKDFIVYGIRYCFPAQPGALVRGVPTASSASPINETISSNGEKYVWSDPDGNLLGQAIVPLYGNAVLAAKNDADMHALLSIVDSFRIGKSREVKAACVEFEKYLKKYEQLKQ